MHSFRKSRVFKYTVRPGAVLLLCECVHKSAGALVPQVCVWYHYISCGFAGGGAITAGQWKAFEVAGSLNRGLFFFCGSLALCQKESWQGWWSCLPIRATNGHKARRLGFLPMSAARETREWGFIPECLSLLSQKVAS